MIKSRLTYFLLIAAAFFAGVSVRPGPANSAEPQNNSVALKVMTFNIRTLAVTDGRDFWSFRKNEVAGLIKRYAPDVAGLQEAYPIQARALARRLPDYEWFGTPRDDGDKIGEMCAVFYRRDRLELMERGTYWLSEDPEEAGSRSWDSALPRVVTWGKFQDKDSGAVFYAFNTHFDHQGKKARQESARVLAEKLGEIAGDAPAVVTGDFNTTDDRAPYQAITGTLEDSRRITINPPRGPAGTSRGFRLNSEVKKRIDYIFVTPGIRVMEYASLDDVYGRGRRPSDHLPVLVSLEIPGG